MQKSSCPLWLLIGDYKIPENLEVIAAVKTSRFPIGAVLLKNQFGIYCLWHSGNLSSCNQKEAKTLVNSLNNKGD